MKRLLFFFLLCISIASCNSESDEITAVKDDLRKQGANDEVLKSFQFYQEKEKTDLALQKIIERYTRIIAEHKDTDVVNRTSFFLTQKIDSVKTVFSTIKLDSVDKVKVVKKVQNFYIHKNYYLANGKIIDHSEGYGK